MAYTTKQIMLILMKHFAYISGISDRNVQKWNKINIFFLNNNQLDVYEENLVISDL